MDHSFDGVLLEEGGTFFDFGVVSIDSDSG